MMASRRRNWSLLALMLMVIVFTCSKDSTEPQATPPALPPESSFFIDFSDFTGKDNITLPKGSDILLQTYENWGWAVLNVAVWNTILTVNLAVPVAAFKASFYQTPVQQPDGSWVWSYQFNAGMNSYNAELHGAVTAEGTHWEMYISKDQGFQKFLWYTGGSDLPHSQGSWLLYKSPADPVPYIEIEWSRSLQDSTGEIVYTHVEGGDQSAAGGYIHYGRTVNLPYDCFYKVYAQTTNNQVDIEWSRQNVEGRVRDELHFENLDWHCWNEALEDTECP